MPYIRKGRSIPRDTPKWRGAGWSGSVFQSTWEQETAFVGPSQLLYTWEDPKEEDVLRDLHEEATTRRSGFDYDPKYDRGHEFWTSKTSQWLSHPDAYLRSTDSYGRPVWMRGPLVPYVGSHAPLYLDPFTKAVDTSKRDPFPPLVTQDSDAASLGATAISRVAPGAPSVSIAASLGELVQGLPSLPAFQLLKPGAKPRDLAGEHLNLQFAVMPTVSDVRNIVKTLRNYSETLLQLRRDSGKAVRRKYRFPGSVTSTTQDLSVQHTGPLYGNPGWYSNTEARYSIQRTIRTDREVWFSGAFTYYVPMADAMETTLVDNIRHADHVLGLRFTAETLWQLTPWSWLVDWISNVGDVVSNAQRLGDDGLVIRYGYLMVKTTTDHTYSTLPGLQPLGSSPLPVVQASFRRETKRRYRATPFGFGFEWEGFSPAQWSILAALGISQFGGRASSRPQSQDVRFLGSPPPRIR